MKEYAAIMILAASAASFAQQPVDSADQVLDALAAAGYTGIREIELDDGLWEAEVQGENGRHYDLHIVPATGAILDKHSGTPVMNADTVRATLEASGYTNVHDLDLDDAVWEAEAVDPDGHHVDLVIDGFDGAILLSSFDD